MAFVALFPGSYIMVCLSPCCWGDLQQAQKMLQGQMVFVCLFLSTTALLAGQPPVLVSLVSLLQIFLMPLKDVVNVFPFPLSV